MPAISYPPTLPPPSLWGGVARERRALSSLPGNTQMRNRTRDALNDIDASWMYTSAEMASWRAWYEATLLDGMLWFAITVPGAGGWVPRVVKFRTSSLRKEHLGNGVYRVSAQLQQRGISAAPLWIPPLDLTVSTVDNLQTNLSWISTGAGVNYTVYRSIDGGAPTLVFSGTGLTWGEGLPAVGVPIVYIVTASTGESRSAEVTYWGVIDGLAGLHADANAACDLRWPSNLPTTISGWGGICYGQHQFGGLQATSWIEWFGAVV